MWRVLFFVLFCCFCFALESKVDSTKNIESKSQDFINITESNMKDSTKITESARLTQDSTNMIENITESNKTDVEKLQDSINITESKTQSTESKKDSIQFNPKSKTPRFPLLDKKEKTNCFIPIMQTAQKCLPPQSP